MKNKYCIIKYYYKDEDFTLLHGDSFKILKKLESKSIDMIFADPPYFLSGDRITCSACKMVSVKKGAWDEKNSIKEKHNFNKKWIKLCNEVLKDNGTIWISGTSWRSARKNLEETFNELETIYSIDDIENGILTEIIK